MSTELATLLGELDDAISAANRKFHGRLKRPASAADLAKLALALKGLPADVAVLFAWHGGSQDGFLPGSSVALIEPSEAFTEIEFLRENPPDRALPEPFCPWLTDRAGSLWIWADGQPAQLWQYERGEVVKVEPFVDALRRMRDAWVDEKSLVRVGFVRVGRSMVGWRQVELPLEMKKKALALLKTLSPGRSLTFATHSQRLRVRCGEQPAWSDNGRTLCVDVSAAGLAEVLAALHTGDSAVIAGTDDARICFSEM